MPRPPNPDPSVPLPVRIPTSLLEHLRFEASKTGTTLTSLCIERLAGPYVSAAPGGAVVSTTPNRYGRALVPRPAPSTPQARPKTLIDKTERVSVRPDATRCSCEEPKISRVAPICTNCRLPR